jgi:WD40 repeat protein
MVLPHETRVFTVAFAPDGRLATAASDQRVRIFDVRAGGKLLNTLDGHRRTPRSIAFDQSGRRMVTAAHDKSARVWDSATDKVVSLDLTTEIHTAALSPDGRIVVTGTSDRHVVVWDLESAKPIYTYLHGGAVFGVRFTPDSKHVVSSGTNRKILVWEADTHDGWQEGRCVPYTIEGGFLVSKRC